jgi:LacI family transcriptional regulator
LPDVKAGSRAVGIKDVALAAGVSATTVSHVLNDAPYARISPETRSRVKAAAEQLDYDPNRLAQALRSRRSGVLGLVFEDIANAPHAGRIIQGVDAAARARGYTIMVAAGSGTPGSGSREAEVEVLLGRQVDGILYAGSSHHAVGAPANLGLVPAVLLDTVNNAKGCASVGPDLYAGARIAVDILLRAGHTRLGFLASTEDAPSTHALLRGFRDALTGAGADDGAAPVEAAAPDARGGYEAARRILAGGNPPSGLFCCSDRMAMGAYRAAAELDLSIPADLSVVGFGNQEEIASSLHPGLTSVALPHYEMGAWAAGHLIAACEGGSAPPAAEAEPVLLACAPVLRASVAGPRPADRAH